MRVGGLEETITVSGGVAGRRPAVVDPAAGHDPAAPGVGADRPQHLGGRVDAERRDAQRPRRRRHGRHAADLHGHPRLRPARQRHPGRRHERQRHRRRRGHPELLQPGHVRGDELPDQRPAGRDSVGWRAPEHDSQGRQQHLPGIALLHPDAELVPEQQPHARPRGAGTQGAEPGGEDSRLQRRARRAGHQEQAVVLHLAARLGRGPDGDRLLLQRRYHPADVPARPLQADRRRQPDQERDDPHDLPDVAQAQVRRLRRRHHQVPRARVRHQHVPDRRGLRHPQPQALLHRTGEVHRHDYQQPAVRRRLVGERRDLFHQRDPGRHAGEQHRPRRPADDRSVVFGDRPGTTSASPIATPSRARRPTSPGRTR